MKVGHTLTSLQLGFRRQLFGGDERCQLASICAIVEQGLNGVPISQEQRQIHWRIAADVMQVDLGAHLQRSFEGANVALLDGLHECSGHCHGYSRPTTAPL